MKGSHCSQKIRLPRKLAKFAELRNITINKSQDMETKVERLVDGYERFTLDLPDTSLLCNLRTYNKIPPVPLQHGHLLLRF